MRVLLCAIVVLIGAALLWPAESFACSYAQSPGVLALPSDEGLGVPLNAKIHVATRASFSDPGDFALVLLDGSGGVEVPVSVDPLPFASELEGRVRLTPGSDLNPNSTYAVCHWPTGALREDAGCPQTGRIGTFTTGTDALTSPPPDATGLVFEVADRDFPDAGPNLFCTGPRRVRGISVHVPDAGQPLLFFGRAGDTGIFSAEPGSWLPTGISTADGRAAGILACDGNSSTPSTSWGLPTGTTALEVWTEDIAGNASAPILVPLNGDCSTLPEEGADDTPDEQPAAGCSGSGVGFTALSLGALLVLVWRHRSS